MKSITLQAIPNQEIIVTLDDARYNIKLKSASGFMTYGIERGGIVIIENGTRIVSGLPLFPYRYMESGNFILDAPDGSEADYNQFEVTQFLRYASQEEIESVR